MSVRGTPDEIAALKIGDTLYNFDGNRRVYRAKGLGSPIYEKYFDAQKIVGETKLSWVMEYGTKVNKKTLDSACHYADRGYFTKSGMEADIWSHDHRHKIVREVERVSVEHLKEIARIIGYRASAAEVPDDRSVSTQSLGCGEP